MSSNTSTLVALAAATVATSATMYFLSSRGNAEKSNESSIPVHNDLVLKKEKVPYKYDIPDAIKRSKYRAEVELACELAIMCGKNMLTHYETVGTDQKSSLSVVITKGSAIDFATDIDTQNEKMVIDSITRIFPNHEIIGEESCANGIIPKLTDKPTWIVDPVDGTTNFANGLPMTCVSIGFCVGGKPIMGVVYAPMTDELFIGLEGIGSYRNNVRLVNSKQKTTLKESIVCFEFGYARSPESTETMVRAVKNLLLHGVKSCKCIGSGVLDLCYVARGSIEVVYSGVADEGWKPWDFCAGLVILKEAGCTAKPVHLGDEACTGDEFNIYARNGVFGVNEGVVNECRQVITS